MSSLRTLLINTRFYILTAAVLGSLFGLAFFRIKFPSDQLYYIRVEQLFGLVSAVLVYVAILITPLSKLQPKLRLTKQLLFARRAIGVAAAYYAALHVFISIQKQLGGFTGALLLPTSYKLSFGLASIALLVLIAMAVTSFDVAMRLLTFRRWKQLHRFIYPASLLIVIHIWLIGTHVEYAGIRYATYVALGLLIILESFRIAAAIKRKWQLERSVYFATAVSLCVLGLVSLVGLPLLAQDYHGEQSNHSAPGIEFHGHDAVQASKH